MNLAILKILVPSTCWYLLRFLRYSISQYTVYKPKYIVRFLLQSENVDNLHMESLYADFKFCWIQALFPWDLFIKWKLKMAANVFGSYSNFWHLITFLWTTYVFSGILSHGIILRLYSLPVVEKCLTFWPSWLLETQSLKAVLWHRQLVFWCGMGKDYNDKR